MESEWKCVCTWRNLTGSVTQISPLSLPCFQSFPYGSFHTISKSKKLLRDSALLRSKKTVEIYMIVKLWMIFFVLFVLLRTFLGYSLMVKRVSCFLSGIWKGKVKKIVCVIFGGRCIVQIEKVWFFNMALICHVELHFWS